MGLGKEGKNMALLGSKNPRWKGGKNRFPACTLCGKRLSYYSKKEEPKCHSCMCKTAPWGKAHFNFKGYMTSGKGGHKEVSETWKRKLLERDGYKCVHCGESNRHVLQGCHLKPRAKFPELAIDLDNGVILCANCHILQEKGFITFNYPYERN